MRVGCAEEGNGGCFNGGLIDDISAPNRIIMTASNETYYCWADLDGDEFSEWPEAFIDALHGEDTYWNDTTREVVHTGIEVDADVDNNGHVSMWEAWDYAWNHDDARLLGWETPWLDDNGNGLPTYINEGDALDENDGWLASCTYLEPYPWCDNFDDNSIDPTRWEKLEAGGATVAEINQRLEVTVPSGSGWAQSGVVTKDYYPMQNFSVEIYVAELDSIHEMHLQIGLTKTTSSDPYFESNWYRIVKWAPDNRLCIQRRVNGELTTLVNIPWEDATGKLQILIRNSTIYFYENGVFKYSEPYQLSSYNCYTYIFTSTETSSASGTDAFDNFKHDFSVFVHSLTVQTWVIGYSEITDVKVWIDGTQYYSPVTVTVSEGTHSVKVPSFFYRGPPTIRFKYEFRYWLDEENSTSNPRTLLVDHDVTIKAYYEVTFIGCPTLFVWNGTEYVEEGILDIHGESDVTVRHVLGHTPIAEDGFYLLSLRELDEFTSHIDQVKLCVVDIYGNLHRCRLAEATHSELGDVKAELRFNDQTRVDLHPTQTIDLKFKAPNIQVAFIFVINGYNTKIQQQ